MNNLLPLAAMVIGWLIGLFIVIGIPMLLVDFLWQKRKKRIRKEKRRRQKRKQRRAGRR